MSERYVLQKAADVRRERIRHIVEGRAAIGSVTLVAGSPGEGKSLYNVTVAAGLSRGELPGAYYGQPARSLIVSVEDHRAAVIVPRLVAAGADLSMISFLDIEATDNEDLLTLSLPRHEQLLADAIYEWKPVLTSIDPITAVLGGDVDSHKDASVRRVLTPLGKLAEQTNSSMMVVMHTNKSYGDDPLRRLNGSIGFPAAARNVLLLARDPGDPKSGRRMLAHVKSNTGAYAPTLVYEIEGVTLPESTEEPECTTAKLMLIGETDLDGRALLASPDGDERSETDDAVELLEAELAAGQRLATEMQSAADSAGIGKKALRRARERLRLVVTREGFGSAGRWHWSLPIDAPPAIDAPLIDKASMDTEATYGGAESETGSQNGIDAPTGNGNAKGIYVLTESEEARLYELEAQMELGA